MWRTQDGNRQAKKRAEEEMGEEEEEVEQVKEAPSRRG